MIELNGTKCLTVGWAGRILMCVTQPIASRHSAGLIGEEHPELESLRAYRLEHSLTYRELADQISETCAPGRGVTHANLHALLTGLRVRSSEITLFKVRRFMSTVDGKRKVARRQQRPIAVAAVEG